MLQLGATRVKIDREKELDLNGNDRRLTQGFVAEFSYRDQGKQRRIADVLSDI
jgi:hypothetical protein